MAWRAASLWESSVAIDAQLLRAARHPAARINRVGGSSLMEWLGLWESGGREMLSDRRRDQRGETGNRGHFAGSIDHLLQHLSNAARRWFDTEVGGEGGCQVLGADESMNRPGFDAGTGKQERYVGLVLPGRSVDPCYSLDSQGLGFAPSEAGTEIVENRQQQGQRAESCFMRLSG